MGSESPCGDDEKDNGIQSGAGDGSVRPITVGTTISCIAQMPRLNLKRSHCASSTAFLVWTTTLEEGRILYLFSNNQ